MNKLYELRSITALYEQIQELEDSIYNLDSGRQLWNGVESPSMGQQLDNIGTIVGISRNGLSDAQYLLFIFGKIAENFSDSTLDSITSVVGYLFQADQIIVQELPPAGLLVEAFGSNIPDSLFSFAKNLVKAAMGAGIGAKIYKDSKEAFGDSKPILYQEPTSTKLYEELYSEWKYFLEKQIVE